MNGGEPSTELQAWAAASIPATTRKIVVRQLSANFVEATELVEAPLANPLPAGHVLVRNCHVGINASDVSPTTSLAALHPSAASAAVVLHTGRASSQR